MVEIVKCNLCFDSQQCCASTWNYLFPLKTKHDNKRIDQSLFRSVANRLKNINQLIYSNGSCLTTGAIFHFSLFILFFFNSWTYAICQFLVSSFDLIIIMCIFLGWVAVVNLMNINAVGECSDRIMRKYYILISKESRKRLW